MTKIANSGVNVTFCDALPNTGALRRRWSCVAGSN